MPGTALTTRHNTQGATWFAMAFLLCCGTATAVRGANTYTLEVSALAVGSVSGSATVALDVSPAGAAWTASPVDAWLHLSPANSSGTGSAIVQFTYDANPNAGSRIGTFAIQGNTLTVTQAGTSYVPANPITTLVPQLSLPYGVAVDGSGNLYIADLGLRTVTMWNAATQTTSTLISGLNQPRGMAVDAAGNVYVADEGDNEIVKWTSATQTSATLISSGLNLPQGVAVDASGNVYIANFGNSTIKEWTNGTLSTLISTGLTNPSDVAVDGFGNLFISDFGSDSIKKWTASTQTLSTLIGAGLSGPVGVAVDGSGNVFIADTGDNAVKTFTAATQMETTVVQTQIISVQGVAVDKLGNVYISDKSIGAIYESSGAFVGPVAFTEGQAAGSDMLLPVLPTTTRLTGTNFPTSNQTFLTIGSTSLGVIHFSFTANTTVMDRTASVTALGQPVVVTQKSLVTVSLANLPSGAVGVPYTKSVTATVNGGTGPLTLTLVNFSAGVTGMAAPTIASNTLTFNSTPTKAGNVSFDLNVKDSKNVVVTQHYAFTIVAPVFTLEASALTVGAASGTNTIALDVTTYNGAWTANAVDSWLHVSGGSTSGAGSSLLTFTYDANPGVPVRAGTLNIQGNTLTVTQAGTIHVAVNPVTTLVSMGLDQPSGLAVDTSGNAYIADANNKVVKKWTVATQSLTTLSGASATYFEGLAVDAAGNIYIANTTGNSIDKFVPSTQTLTTVSAGFLQPCGVAVDPAGNLYVADFAHNEIKKIAATTHAVTTIVGTGVTNPRGIAVDGAGNVYIADSYNNSIKKWSVATETVTTVATIGLSYFESVAVDGSGNIYISDYGNSAIEKWTAATQSMSTLVGTGLSHPFGVAVDPIGNVYIDDYGHNAFKEATYAFVGPVFITEGSAAGTDSLLQVLPATTPLVGSFAPTSDKPFLTIGAISNGIISFSFTANNTGADRTANITVLGQNIAVTQKSITVSPATLPPSTAGILYGQVITASGGTGNKTMAIANYSDGGSGLAAPTATANTLTFSATPTAGGTVSFDVTATDTGNSSQTQHYSFVINPVVAFNPATLPPAAVNTLYNQVVTATGGTGTDTMVVTNFNAGGTGLTTPAIAPNTATFNSTPTSTGTVSFDVTATDTLSATAMQHYSFAVKTAALFSNLSAPTTAYGMPNTLLSGTLSAGNQFPTGSVSITLNGVTQTAAISGTDGSFSSSFATAALGAAGSPYVVNYSYSGDANFNPVSNNSESLVVNPLAVTVNGLAASSKIYDGGNTATLTGSAVLAGVLPGDIANVSLSGTAAGLFSDKNAGVSKTVTVSGLTLSGSAASNYALTAPALTANISAAPLTITTNAATSIYGATPAFTVSYATFAGSDTAASLSGTLAFTTQATSSSPVGIYAVTPTGVASTNYTIAFAPGNLSITPAPLTITAKAATNVYGAALPAFAVTYATFVSGDTAASLGGTLAFTTTATANSPVGIYSVTPTGATSNNYTIVFAPANLTITPAPLTITGLTASNKVYDGTTTVVLTGTPALTGVVAGDSANVALSGTAAGVFSDQNAGTGKVVAVSGLSVSGSAVSNYTLTPLALTGNITPAPLTIKASSATVVLGSVIPPYSATFATFVGGDTVASLTGTLTFTTTATASSPPGDYSVMPGGVSSGNYTIVFVDGKLTIASAPPVVSSGLGASLPTGISGLPVQFSFAVSDTLPVTYVWTWGDGTSTTTSSTSLGHVYSQPGTYTVSVIATDTANLSVTSPSMVYTVAQAGLCDGLNPLNLHLQQVAVKLSFPSGANKDSLTLKGIVQLPDGFVPLGQIVQWNIAGIAGTGTLDASGKLAPKSTSTQVALAFKKPKKGAAFTASPATLTIALKNQTLSTALQLFGIDTLNANSANKKGDATSADACVVLKGTQAYQGSITGTYLGKVGKSGVFSGKAK